jgi:hypothetical protein
VVSHNHFRPSRRLSVERLPEAMPWFVPMGLAEWFLERGAGCRRAGLRQSARWGALKLPTAALVRRA